MAWNFTRILPPSPFKAKPKGTFTRPATFFGDTEKKKAAPIPSKPAPKLPVLKPGKSPVDIVRGVFEARDKARKTPPDFREGERAKGGPNITPVPFDTKKRPDTIHSGPPEEAKRVGLDEIKKGGKPEVEVLARGADYELTLDAPVIIPAGKVQEFKDRVAAEVEKEHPELSVLAVNVTGKECRVHVRPR